jgi:hypothetical protein
MDISNFLNLVDENVEPPTDLNINLNSIIISHTEQLEESSDEEVDISIPTSAEAIKAVELLL